MPDTSSSRAEGYTRDGFRFFTASPTRWGDCDKFGHVNNVKFVRYYEAGRLDYFDSCGEIPANGLDQSISGRRQSVESLRFGMGNE